MKDEQTVRLPVLLGTMVWRVRENPACHDGVRHAERFLFGRVCTPRRIVEPVPFTLALLEDWGKTVFLTEEEGKRHIADGADKEGDSPPSLPENNTFSGKEAKQNGSAK